MDISTRTGQQTGLLGNSVIMTDNIATVLISEIYQKIGTFVEQKVLQASLKHTFGI